MLFYSFYAMRLAYWGMAVVVSLSAAAHAQDHLRLGIEGLDGIGAATRLDAHQLGATFPNYKWASSRRATEDGSQQILDARRKGKNQFTLVGDGQGRVAAIEVQSSRVGNWLGPRVGDAYRPLSENAQLGDCTAGSETFAGTVVCNAAESENITYVFSGLWNGPDGQLPPAQTLDDWAISQIIWRPVRFALEEKPVASSPAFDCTKAQGSIEEMICNSAELADLDRRLSALYSQKIAATPETEKATLKALQRGWLKARNECWKSSSPHRCVKVLHMDRIVELTMTDETLSLPGSSWQGMRIAGDEIPGRIDVNLTFGTDGNITGNSGCNRFFAAFSQNGHELQIGQIGGTRRMCPELEMLAEHRFLAAFEQVNKWAMHNGQLVLFGSGAELTFAQR